MRRWALVMLAGMAIAILAGCGAGQKSADSGKSQSASPPVYKDGTYTARSSPDERGAVGEITLVIEKGKISKAGYKGIMKDGKPKDADYGKTNGKIENQDFYRKAQLAVKAMASYPLKLVEMQDVDAVDAISGATVSYRQFNEAVKTALNQAAVAKPAQ